MTPMQSRLPKRTGLPLATLLVLFGVAHGDVYKYVDANGNVVFTDEPPADIEVESVDLPSFDPPSTPTPVGRVKRPPEPNQDFDKAKRQRIDNLVQEQVSAHERRCNEARVALEVLHQGMPVYLVGDGDYRAAWYGDTYEGSRTYLSEKQRSSAIDEQLRKLAFNCADPLSEDRQEQASSNWINEEKCVAARKDLELFLQPNSRASDEFLNQKRDIVERYCVD